jgi:hypothetical protein
MPARDCALRNLKHLREVSRFKVAGEKQGLVGLVGFGILELGHLDVAPCQLGKDDYFKNSEEDLAAKPEPSGFTLQRLRKPG